MLVEEFLMWKTFSFIFKKYDPRLRLNFNEVFILNVSSNHQVFNELSAKIVEKIGRFTGLFSLWFLSTFYPHLYTAFGK